MQFKYVNDLETYYEACVTIDKSPRVALDTETYTLPKYNNQDYAASELRTNPHTGACSLVSICTDASVGAETLVIDLVVLEHLGYDPTLLYTVLSTRQYLVAHQAKFDSQMLSKQLGWLTNWECTLTLAQLYSNATGSKLWQTRGMNLASCCRDWLGVSIEGKGTTQVSEWYCLPSERHLDNPIWYEKLCYAAGDVKYLLQLRDTLTYVLACPLPPSPLLGGSTDPNNNYGLGMGSPVRLENSLVAITAKMEASGSPYSAIAAKAWEAAVNRALTNAAIEVCEALSLPTTSDGLWGSQVPDPSSLKVLNNPKKLLSEIQRATGINLNTAQAAILRRASDLLSALSQVPDSEQAEIETIDSEADLYAELVELSKDAQSFGMSVLANVLDYKKLVKQQGMFLGRYVNPESKRIHARYAALRTSTGRYACSAPNFQQMSARLDLELEFSKDDLSKLVEISAQGDVTDE